MSTIDSPEIIRKILLNNGTYPGDPQLYSVLTYLNNWGDWTFKICTTPHAHREAITSPYVNSPALLWSREKGLTAAGKTFLSPPPVGSHEEESE